MPEPLSPFSGDTPTCPKCGNRKASTAWWCFGRIDGERVSLGNPDLWPERLHRECLRCSYGWDEAVVSEKPPTAPVRPCRHNSGVELQQDDDGSVRVVKVPPYMAFAPIALSVDDSGLSTDGDLITVAGRVVYRVIDRHHRCDSRGHEMVLAKFVRVVSPGA